MQISCSFSQRNNLNLGWSAILRMAWRRGRSSYGLWRKT